MNRVETLTRAYRRATLELARASMRHPRPKPRRPSDLELLELGKSRRRALRRSGTMSGRQMRRALARARRAA